MQIINFYIKKKIEEPMSTHACSIIIIIIINN